MPILFSSLILSKLSRSLQFHDSSPSPWSGSTLCYIIQCSLPLKLHEHIEKAREGKRQRGRWSEEIAKKKTLPRSFFLTYVRLILLYDNCNVFAMKHLLPSPPVYKQTTGFIEKARNNWETGTVICHVWSHWQTLGQKFLAGKSWRYVNNYVASSASMDDHCESSPYNWKRCRNARARPMDFQFFPEEQKSSIRLCACVKMRLKTPSTHWLFHFTTDAGRSPILRFSFLFPSISVFSLHILSFFLYPLPAMLRDHYIQYVLYVHVQRYPLMPFWHCFLCSE